MKNKPTPSVRAGSVSVKQDGPKRTRWQWKNPAITYQAPNGHIIGGHKWKPYADEFPVAVIPLDPAAPLPSPATLKAIQLLLGMGEGELVRFVWLRSPDEMCTHDTRVMLRALGLLPASTPKRKKTK